LITAGEGRQDFSSNASRSSTQVMFTREAKQAGKTIILLFGDSLNLTKKNRIWTT
jgi:hypothetical protein